MDIASVLIIFALFLGSIWFVSRPLMMAKMRMDELGKGVDGCLDQRKLSALLEERDRIISAIKELDFDYALRKIPEDEYHNQRSALVSRGAGVLKELDDYQKSEAQTKGDYSAQALSDDQSAHFEKMAASADFTTIDDDLEELIAERRRSREEKLAGFCPQCGYPALKSDRFCSRCGSSLELT